MFYKSMIDAIDVATRVEFIDSLPSPEIKLRNPKDSYNPIFECYSNSSALESLLDRTHERYNNNVQSIPRSATWSGDDWFYFITQSPVKVDTYMPFKDIMQEVYEVNKITDGSFAGVILINENGVPFNPLHPLMALTCIDTSAILKQKYRAVLYFYSNREKLEEELELNNEVNDEIIDDTITDLLRLYQNKVQKRNHRIIADSRHNTDINDNIVTQKYQVAKRYGENLDTDYYIVPHQLITYGIMAPFYGVSIVTIGDRDYLLGQSVTPHMSANISFNSRGYLDSVCTGKNPQLSVNGLESLNHSNLSSAMNRSCVMLGALTYADKCIEKSFDIYKMAEIIKEESNEPEKPTIVTAIDDYTGEIYEDSRYTNYGSTEENL